MKSRVILPIIVGLVIVGFIGFISTRSGNQNSNTNSVSDRIEADGTIVKPDGTMVKPDGTMVKPDGTMVGPDGKVIIENSNSSTNSTSANINTSNNSNSTSAAAPAKYIPYSSASLAAAYTVPQGDTVLYFHANWCPTCQVLDPDITKNISQLPIGVTILKVDYDQETALKKKYGVTYQHTFVQVDTNGNKLKLWSGSRDALDIVGQII